MLLRVSLNTSQASFAFMFPNNCIFVSPDLIQSVVSYNSTDISSLHRTLFKDYNKNVLPDYPVNVCIEYNLLTINSLVSSFVVIRSLHPSLVRSFVEIRSLFPSLGNSIVLKLGNWTLLW